MQKVFLLSVIFLITLASSCKKEGNLVPGFDNGTNLVNFTDTLTLKTSLVREDSLRTDISSLNLLGLYHDPIFGLVSSSIYSQISLNGVNVDFGSSSTIDSIVLTLDYSGLYGSNSDPISISVYELADNLISNNAYYSNEDINYNPALIGSKTFTPNITDNVFVDFDATSYEPHLRIPLDTAFGNTLLNASSTDLSNNTNFINFLKGIYITPTDSVSSTTLLAGQGAISYFDLTSSLSTLTLYYTDSSTTAKKYDFTINSESVNYNRFDHNYTGTDIEKQLLGSDFDTTLTYLQPMSGVKVKLEIPFIKELKKEGIIGINKAELVIPIENNSDATYAPLDNIAVVGIDENGNTLFLPDFFEGTEYYGGTFNPSTKTYTFNIARHLQSLLNSTSPDYGLYLVASGSAVLANRSVITTQQNLTSKMKINLTYSKP